MLLDIAPQFAKSLDFKGRSSRRAFLSFIVFFTFISYLYLNIRSVAPGSDLAWQMKWLITFSLVPLPALLVRRLHDIGCSSKISLAWLVPLAGLVLCLWMLLDKGESGENYYGVASD